MCPGDPFDRGACVQCSNYRDSARSNQAKYVSNTDLFQLRKKTALTPICA